MRAALLLATFLSGVALTVQVGMNAALRNAFGHAGSASLANFLVGILGLTAFLVATRAAWPERAAIAGAPAWAWLGGLLGAFYVVVVTIAGPRLGATLLLAVVVLGQLLASLVVDHFGWLGFPVQPVTLARLLGAALLFAGVLLIAR